MAKRLTNLQMTVLSERVTDLLEEAAQAKNQSILESDEYRHFTKTYTDPYVEALKPLAERYNSAEKKIEQLRAEKDMIEAQAKKLKSEHLKVDEPHWRTVYPNSELEKYLQNKKEEKFSEILFDRAKTLRRVQADILLSDVENPDELVKSLVSKLSTNG